MWKNRGIIENWALGLAKYIKNNGGHSDISIGTMRFALQLWISVILIFIFALIIGFFLGTALQTFVVLLTIGILRYFSGGWHFRSLEVCVMVTVSVSVIIPLIPEISDILLYLVGISSLILVLWFAPTGHGQKITTNSQRMLFKSIAMIIVVLSFTHIIQFIIVSMFFQSITLITRKGGGLYEP